MTDRLAEIRERWFGNTLLPHPGDVEFLLAELDAARADDAKWLAWSGGVYPDDSPGDVIAAEADGTIILDDAITTWNPLRALAFYATALEAAEREANEMRASAVVEAQLASEAHAALEVAERDAKSVREKMGHNAANLDVAIEQRQAAEARAEELEAALRDFVENEASQQPRLGKRWYALLDALAASPLPADKDSDA